MNISEDNLFLFDIQGYTTHMRGDAVFRHFALEFDLEKPEYFTGAGSGLRKYLATTMQVSLFNFIETIMCPVDNRS
jgi:hypothetical protein